MPPNPTPWNARASPAGDARRPRPSDATSGQGLPAQGRSRLKKRAHRIRLATLNIGTMTGRSRELADALKNRRIDFACVQETKWKGTKARNIGDGYKMLYVGSTANRNGVAVIVSQPYHNSITDVARVSDRLMSLRVDTGTVILRIVSAYAPQPSCADAEKDVFWTTFDTHLQSIADDELLFVGGDLNGHVGHTRDGFERIHGGNGYGTQNDDGARALECAEAHDLAVTNTFFKKRASHLVTYSSGGRDTQIDYWLTRRRDLKRVADIKVIPSDNVAPQHRLLVLDYDHHSDPRPKLRTTGVERIKWWKMPERKQQLKEALAGLQTDLRQSPAAIWDAAATHIRACATTALGKTKPGRRFIDKQVWWWDEDVQAAVKAKKDALKTWRQTRTDNDLQQYKNLKSATKRTVAAARSAHHKRLYEELETTAGANKIYQLANARLRATQDIGQVVQIKDATGQLLRDKAAILQRWKEHYTNVCNQEFPHPPIPTGEATHDPVPLITAAEVMDAIRRMKNGKATGPDDIPAEAWKLLGQPGAEFLAALFNKIIDDGEVPPAWRTSTTIPIWKGKGDVSDCPNYRPIRLLCHSMKIFERVLDRRIRSIVTISTNQCGFVKGCGTTDAIHAARLLLEKHREKQKKVHVSFLDLEKAFDRVPHELIWYALRSHGVPEAYVRWVQLLYTDVSSIIRCPAGTSARFPIHVGVHQGSALSPLLFILCMDTATADIQTPHPWTLLYADDVMLANEDRIALEQQTQEWNARLGDYGMRLNILKTEYLESGDQTDGSISIGSQQLNKVTEFKYLGSLVSSDGSTIPDVRLRVNAAWMKWRQVTGVLCDRKMPTHLKSNVYKTVVRPVALYGSECWPATKKHEAVLNTMEMRMLRWSIGLTRHDRVPNTDVRRLLGVAPIQEKLREARLRWFGHVMRSKDHSVAKTALNLQVEGRRPRGRPKKPWMDALNEDMRAAGVDPQDTVDRAKWRRQCKRADPAPRRE
uniref:Reverse transcriptase domain-containing protein n=1 Tax=Plectus sambesii TaxID=2011161 RepID=A0A914WDC8_9BILA